MTARSGSILLICVALCAGMTAVAFAFVISMRTAAQQGPAGIPRWLAQQASRSGVAQAIEVLAADYLQRPLVPTSDIGPHRILFDPIDNADGSYPTPSSATTSSNAWNDNDVMPGAVLINPYRISSHRVYGFDRIWEGMVTSPTYPRYTEPLHWQDDLSKESATATKVDFTKAATPAVDRPMWYDEGWKPVTDKAHARYRLRYAVHIEDLAGHLLNGLQSPFGRDDPRLADGDPALLPAAQRGKGLGTETDVDWARTYAPAMSGFFDSYYCTPQYDILCLWLGIAGNKRGLNSKAAYSIQGNNDSESSKTIGFDDAGVLRNTTWAWMAHGNPAPRSPTDIAAGVTTNGTISLSRSGKMLSWLSQNIGNGDVGGSYAAVWNRWQPNFNYTMSLTPYGSPSFWARNPDPEAVDARGFKPGPGPGYAWNEGPTDCPWRVNPLTAPQWVLRSMLSAFRTPLQWEQGFNRYIVYEQATWTAGPPASWTWKGSPVPATPGVTDPINGFTYPEEHSIDGRLGTMLAGDEKQFPDPFRASFTTRRRGTSLPVHPFAQFPPGFSGGNPRSQSDPSYPSPVAAYYDDNLGRFSHLYVGNGALFNFPDFGAWGEQDRGLGGCLPRLDSDVRNIVARPAYTNKFIDGRKPGSAWSVTEVAPDPGLNGRTRVYYGDDVHLQRYDSKGKATGHTMASQSEGATEYARDSYWNDARTALGSALAVAIAVHQPCNPDGSQAVKLPSGSDARDLDLDGDGFKESSSLVRNVADLDRLFLLILGEDPDHPGNNPGTRDTLYAVQKGADPALYTGAPYKPALAPLPAYVPAATEFSTDCLVGNVWSQNPYGEGTPINLRRTSLRRLHDQVQDMRTAAPADLDPIDREEARRCVTGEPADADPKFAKVREKMRQLRRCRLRDAERVINDMRMSFFGSNLRYEDARRTAHSSRGKFRPYDLDGDGWAICSAYVPSEVAVQTVVTAPVGVVRRPILSSPLEPMRFSEPSDWTKVVFDELPDDPDRIDAVSSISSISGPVWVCFKDVDTTVVDTLSNTTAASDFSDAITYVSGETANGRSVAGYTRWYYPAMRVEAAVSGDFAAVSDGVAAAPPDTYFSLTGQVVLEKSHFYRLIARGEVWDDWRRKVVDFTTLECALQLDPDGDVLATPGNISAAGKVIDASGMADTAIVYQSWLRDMFEGDKERRGESR
jgi:hypothetical protein